jgi:hypothetical protein
MMTSLLWLHLLALFIITIILQSSTVKCKIGTGTGTGTGTKQQIIVEEYEAEMPTSVPPMVSDARWKHNLTLATKIHKIAKRFVRKIRGEGHRRAEACDMLIAIDEPLYVTYDRDLKNLTKLVQLYVKQLNEIYHRYT